MHILGFDIGGTKTLAVLYDEDGNILKRHETKSCHILQNSEEVIIERLLECKKLIQIKETKVIFGFAGYGNDIKLRARIEKIVSEVFNDYDYKIYNDAILALKASLNGQDGVIAISGTGSIAYSLKDNDLKRAGGFGYFLEDEGSGYYIGKKLLNIFCKQVDGRLPKTELFDQVLNFFKIENPYEIIKATFDKEMGSRDNIAKLTHIVFKLKNDTYCQEIIDDSAKHIASLINYLAKDFKGVVKASCIGGVILNNQNFFDLVKNKLDTNIIFQKPENEAVYGAYIIYKQEY